jgi:uncharacterized phage-associated protein
MYNVIQIANRIVSLADITVGDLISNLKLQKLLYYVQGFHLAMYNKPLFKEDIVAWQYGPVVKEAYHHFKKYGSGHIEIPDDDFDKYYTEFTQEETDLICDVWNNYGQYSAYRLMMFTHDEPPYLAVSINNVISHQSLINYFATQIEE